MKIATLVSEKANYDAQLRGDINAYLIRLKANGITTIGTELMVRELSDMGYVIDAESLVTLLGQSKYIAKVTVDTIDLSVAPGAQGKDTEKDKEKVHKKAVDTAKKRLK